MKPFLITPDGLKSFRASIERNLADFVNTRKPASMVDGIGFVHIYGPLLGDSTPIERAMGATDYESISKDIKELLNDNARALVFVISSPGGSCSGLQDLAEEIQNLSIPTVAFLSGEACSAAYFLASGCSYIVAQKSATVGNIGVILVMDDLSKLADDFGVAQYCFVNEGADLKSTGHLFGLTESQQEFLQTSVDQLGQTFKAHVERNRSVNPEVWRAGWYMAPQSLELGLVDEYGDLQIATNRAIELHLTLSHI